MKLQGKVAVVTGASSGIGEATAHALAQEGASVVLAARRVDRLEKLKKEIEGNGGKVLVVETDVAKRESVYRLAEKTKEAFGRADILVNNAGLMPLSLIKNLHVDEWERMVDVNIKGVLFGVAAFLPMMREQKGGHIVNISSVAGRRVFMGGSVYCATKFAVTAFSEGLRMELSPGDNIRITAIEPGAVETELTNTITDEELKKGMSAVFDITQLQSEDIAEAIRYAVTQPNRVNVNEILVMPTEQKM